MRSGPLLTAMLMAAWPAAAGEAGLQPEARQFGDWQVSCSNYNRCTAFGKAPAEGGWVRILRDPGPDGRTRIHFDIGWGGGEPRAAIDGAPVTNREDLELGGFEASAPLTVARDMAGGSVMTIEDGSAAAAVSLRGVTAALLWIDERQGRLDTPTAFIRVGDRPLTEIPSPPDPPDVHTAPFVDQAGFGDSPPPLPAVIEALPEVAICREETAFSEQVQAGIVAARLDGDTVLWGVPCIAGAYNIGLRFWTRDGEGAPSPVHFPSPVQGPADELINPEYDPATRTMVAFARGRGLGDCGLIQHWTWTTDGFQLTREAEMPECFGVPPDFWPVLWEAAVR